MSKGFRGVRVYALCCVALGLLAVSARASAEQFGNMRFTMPPGWTSKLNGTILFLYPPSVARGEQALVAISPSMELKDFPAQFESVAQRLQTGATAIKAGNAISGRSPEGYSVLRRELAVQQRSGNTLHFFITAANPNKRFESLYFATNSAALFAQYLPAVQQLTQSVRFTAPMDAQAAAPPSAPQHTPAAASGSASPPAYVDPKSRARGEANLNPPPPGRTRLDGLYATRETSGHIGPGGVFFPDFNFRFYYFLPTGYVYLGAKNSTLEEVRCTQATVDKYGEPQCTTYSADGDQIRIGTRNPVRFRRQGDELVIGDYTFSAIPKANNLRLSGSYEYYSAGVAAATSSGIAFTPDGRFKSSSFVGVAVDTGGMPGGAQQPNRTTVSGGKGSAAEGTYRINGYALEMNYSDGRSTRAFFAQVAGQSVVRIGDRVYTRKSG
jgi:hypothetical protein